MKKIVILVSLLLFGSHVSALTLSQVLSEAFDPTNGRLRLKIEAYDSTENATTYTQEAIYNSILDTTSHALAISLTGALTLSGATTLDGGNFIFNEASGDYDFRVESNGNANAIFVDAGNDRVGIFTAAPTKAVDLTGDVLITPTHEVAVTSDSNLIEIDAGDMLKGTTGRTFALNISASRPDGAQFTAGGDDAALKISATNYNTTAQNSYYLRGANVGATNRSAGTLGYLIGGAFSATQKSDSPVVTGLIGLDVTTEQDSPNATVPTYLYGARIRYDAVMASPTESSGLYIYNDSDTALTDPRSAIEISNSAADRDWQYGVYLDDSSISTADLRLNNGETIDNQTNGTIALTASTIKNAMGTTGGLSLIATEATGTADGTGGFDIEVNIPQGALIVGSQLRVDTLLVLDGGGVSWSAAFIDGTTASLGTGLALTKSTKANAFYDVNAAANITSAETDITVTPNAGNITAGVVRCIVYYYAFDAMADAP